MKKLIAGMVAGLVLALPLSAEASAEWKDFAATCLGGLTGEGCIWLVHKEW